MKMVGVWLKVLSCTERNMRSPCANWHARTPDLWPHEYSSWPVFWNGKKEEGLGRGVVESADRGRASSRVVIAAGVVSSCARSCS